MKIAALALALLAFTAVGATTASAEGCNWSKQSKTTEQSGVGA